jgi:hypothetical protein
LTALSEAGEVSCEFIGYSEQTIILREAGFWLTVQESRQTMLSAQSDIHPKIILRIRRKGLPHLLRQHVEDIPSLRVYHPNDPYQKYQ